jgi:hypothetical protein
MGGISMTIIDTEAVKKICESFELFFPNVSADTKKGVAAIMLMASEIERLEAENIEIRKELAALKTGKVGVAPVYDTEGKVMGAYLFGGGGGGGKDG